MFASSTTVNLMGRFIDQAGAPAAVRLSALPLTAGMLLCGLALNAPILGLGYLLVRVFGPEGIDFAARNSVNQWWVKRRGRANAVAGAASAGMYLMPALMHAARNEYGWRVSLVVSGVAFGAVAFLLSFFLMGRPETMGLLPDGAKAGGSILGGKIPSC